MPHKIILLAAGQPKPVSDHAVVKADKPDVRDFLRAP
jgi:hypothetical protein